MRGTPVNTFDLDVVYECGSANIARLLHALDELQVRTTGSDYAWTSRTF